jgi:hypothetical protein
VDKHLHTLLQMRNITLLQSRKIYLRNIIAIYEVVLGGLKI